MQSALADKDLSKLSVMNSSDVIAAPPPSRHRTSRGIM
jgi:hypothetical protein